MDKSKKQELASQVERANRFASLSRHGDWTFYTEWVRKELANYEHLRDSADRSDHIALVRALEGVEVLKGILDGFDKAITKGIDARKKLQEDEVGGTRKKFHPVTGRPQ